MARLTGALSAVPPDRLVSATPLRCRETLASLAELLGLPVKVDGAFDEDAPDGLAGAEAALRTLAAEGGSTAVCSQGKVIPPLLRRLRPAQAGSAEEFQTPKGTGWLLAWAGDSVLGADRLEA